MIRSYKDRATANLAARRGSTRIPISVQRAALRKLRMIDAAVSLMDLTVPPGNRLEALRGDRLGAHSIRVNDRWRICFRWEGSDAFDVELVDYH